jgi:hypothetical protein
MADIPARTEIGVTTGPIRGSRKIHVGPLASRCARSMLEPSLGEPPLRVYDTSAPTPTRPASTSWPACPAPPRLDRRPRRRRGMTQREKPPRG